MVQAVLRRHILQSLCIRESLYAAWNMLGVCVTFCMPHMFYLTEGFILLVLQMPQSRRTRFGTLLLIPKSRVLDRISGPLLWMTVRTSDQDFPTPL